jgi:hypothetical protein
MEIDNLDNLCNSMNGITYTEIHNSETELRDLQKNVNIADIDVNLEEVKIRYLRYIHNIVNWTMYDYKLGIKINYDYIKNKIIEFLNDNNHENKIKLFRFIDYEFLKLLNEL